MRDRGIQSLDDGEMSQSDGTEKEPSPEVREALQDLRLRLEHPQSIPEYDIMLDPQKAAWHIIRREYIRDGKAEELLEKIYAVNRYSLYSHRMSRELWPSKSVEGLNVDWKRFKEQDISEEAVVEPSQPVTAQDLQMSFPDYGADLNDWQRLVDQIPGEASFFMIGQGLRELPDGEEYHFEKIRDLIQSFLRSRIGKEMSEEDKEHDSYLSRHLMSLLNRSSVYVSALSPLIEKPFDVQDTWGPAQMLRATYVAADLICKYGIRPELRSGEGFFADNTSQFPSPFAGQYDRFPKKGLRENDY